MSVVKYNAASSTTTPNHLNSCDSLSTVVSGMEVLLGMSLFVNVLVYRILFLTAL